MPRGDRRGPGGMGPMTGRGLGYCNGFDAPGFTADEPPRGGAGYGRGYGGRGRGGMGFGPGFGYGRGRGYGRGWDRPSYSASASDSLPSEVTRESGFDLAGELAFLKEEIKALAGRLDKLAKDD